MTAAHFHINTFGMSAERLLSALLLDRHEAQPQLRSLALDVSSLLPVDPMTGIWLPDPRRLVLFVWKST